MHDIASHPDETLLTEYLLGKLSDSDTSIVEDHLVECEQCSLTAQSMQPRDVLMDLVTEAAHSRFNLLAESRNIPACSNFAVTLNSETVSTSVYGSPLDAEFVSLPDSAECLPPELENHKRYRIIRMLGRGGMGCVWLAEHLVLGRLVALKMLRGDWLQKSNAMERFDREIRSTAKLHHPNIATVHDAEQIGDSHFLVMEYVEGETLEQIVSRGPLHVTDACRIIRDAAAGLAHAHAAGLIHRDVKPANMMRTPSGEVKVLDFGLVVSSGESSLLTGQNLVMGTPDYISPEQAEDPRRADERSDIYSLGCTFYQLLTGHVPFPDRTAVQKIDAHRQLEAAVIANVPDSLNRIARRMMAKCPADRYQSADEIVEAIDDPAMLEFGLPTITNEAQRQLRRLPEASFQERTNGKRTLFIKLLFALIPIAIFLGAVTYRIKTDHGELVIETASDDVSVTVRQGGKIVTIIDTKTRNRVTLKSGRYQLEIDGKKTDLQLDLKEVTLTRGSEAIAAIQHVDHIKADDIAESSDVSPPVYTNFRHRLSGPSAISRVVRFSPDSTQVFTASDDGIVRLWNVATGTLLGTFDHRDEEGTPLFIMGLTLVDRGATLISSQEDRLRIWDVASRQEKQAGFDPIAADKLFGIDASSDGSQVAAGTVSGGIRVWDVASRKIVRQSPGPCTYSVKWLPNRPELLADSNYEVVLYNVERNERRVLAQHGNGYIAVAVSRDGKEFASILWNSHVIIQGADSVAPFPEFDSSGCRLEFMTDARLVTSGIDGSTHIWDCERRIRRATFVGGNNEGVPLAVSPDGRWISTGGDNHSILLWEMPLSPGTNP